jgi:carbamoyl-phosphate synthase small subunit
LSTTPAHAITLPPPYLSFDTCLALEDGRVFFGQGFGAPVEAAGEVVFNTSMSGYQEIATDPSYHGQMVVLTHPQIGNYGAQAEAIESKRPWIAALIVRDLAQWPNHWLADARLEEFLARAGVPGLQGIDTRALTIHLRTHGTMRAVLRTVQPDANLEQQVTACVRAARAVTPLSDKNLLEDASDPPSVSVRTVRPVAAEPRTTRLRIAVVDCGIKHNIARSIAARGGEVIPLPWDATIDDVLTAGVAGVVVSNGPGDPERAEPAVVLVNGLFKRAIPTLGICLGHQVLGLAAGGTTSRLKFGHHGGNHPVRDLLRERVHITSQNHEFQVNADSIPASSGFFVSMVNLNDGSVEGLAHRELPAFSVQYHPEGCPGPQDNQYVFERFLAMVDHPVSGAEALGRTMAAIDGGAPLHANPLARVRGRGDSLDALDLTGPGER